MGRRRTRNKHLPLRVYLKHGRFWYVDRTGKWHDLGRTASEMYRELARRAESCLPANSLNAVFDRYLVERLPQLAPRTQGDYQRYIQNLRRVFGTAPPAAVTAGHVFDYRNKRAETSVVQANREKSCLSAVFTAAVEWRIVNDNPCRQVPKIEEPPRDRYVTDAEFTAVYRLASPILQCAMDLAT
ncbi:MAG: tyrosine-type recombinase/integrase, partial [Rhizomicrobium sp.]